MFKNSYIYGYSLLEILLTLSIVSLSLSCAVPCFCHYYHVFKTMTVNRQIINELHLARNIAITTQQNVSYGAGENGSWEKQRYIRDSKGRILHTFSSLPPHYHLILRNSLRRNEAITYTPLGFTLAQRSSFYLDAPDGIMRIILSVSGRVRVEKSERQPN